MYTPSHFTFDNPHALLDFIDENSFATLVTTTGGALSVSKLPFLVDRTQHCLYGHLARANPHWRTLEAADELLVIFDGPHAYISPTWYATPDLVPTWNYSTVTVRGAATLVEGRDAVWQIVSSVSRKHEAGRPAAWDPDSLPEEKRNAMLKAVVGFRIAIDDIQGKRKLSQNRAAADIRGAITGLQTSPGPTPGDAVAQAMIEATDLNSPAG